MDPVQKAISKVDFFSSQPLLITFTICQHAVSKLQKFTPKQISENKLKAFSIGNMGRAVPAKDIEERKKRREEKEALKNVQNEFVEHFSELKLFIVSLPYEIS